MASTGVHSMDDVDLHESDSHERNIDYRNLPIHQLSQDQELAEVNLHTTHSKEEQLHLQKQDSGSDREFRSEIGQQQGAEVVETVTVRIDAEDKISSGPTSEREQQEISQLPIAQTIGGPKKAKKKVQISFPRFPGSRQNPEGAGHDTESSPPPRQREPIDYKALVTITFYPRYMMRPMGILRAIQILLGIIVCSATNAEQCFDVVNAGVVCVPPSSKFWADGLGGQGYVLFVGIVFILGNFAWIFYHMYKKPTQTYATQTTSPTQFLSLDDKPKLAELIYDGAAVIMYIIAASVEAWYASWTTMPYKSQWIAATVFAWFNVIAYGIGVAVNLFLV